MIQFHSLDIPQLERFLERSRSGFSLRGEGVDLDLVLRQILQKAYEFVPSESGSILLDDPFRKVAQRRDNELVFIATFGDSSRDLIGKRLAAEHGIVGRVYQNGAPYLSADVEEDRFFYPEIDEEIGHKTHSIVAVPIWNWVTRSCAPLDTGDTRLVNALYRDGFIWTAHTVSFNGLSACRWYKVNPGSSTLVDSVSANTPPPAFTTKVFPLYMRI